MQCLAVPAIRQHGAPPAQRQHSAVIALGTDTGGTHRGGHGEARREDPATLGAPGGGTWGARRRRGLGARAWGPLRGRPVGSAAACELSPSCSRRRPRRRGQARRAEPRPPPAPPTSPPSPTALLAGTRWTSDALRPLQEQLQQQRPDGHRARFRPAPPRRPRGASPRIRKDSRYALK